MIPVIADAVNWLFNILIIMLFIRVLLSWMPMVRGRVIAFILAFTEPLLAPVRKLIDRSPLGGPGMMLDFSPIIVIFMLRLMQSFVASMLRTAVML